MAKTSRDAYRHARAWSKFFSEGKAITIALTDDFVSRYKKKKYLRQSLRRMIERGLIVKAGNKLTPSRTGLKLFTRNEARIFSPKLWDGKWYLISFDIPNKLTAKRDHLRRILRLYNFYPFQKSVWAAPQQLGSEIWEFIVENDLDKYCKVMIVNVLEGDEELRKDFKLSS